MAPVALVLTTHLLMQQVSWRRPTPGRPVAPAPQANLEPEQEGGSQPAHPHRSGDHPAPEPAGAEQLGKVGARARVQAAYQAQLAAGQTPTGAGLARAAGVSERYGQRLLAEFTAASDRTGHPNGDSPTGRRKTRDDPSDNNKGR
jgi:hypothetical protein